jgi:Domain of unknown function (DUF5122) beta-propeller
MGVKTLLSNSPAIWPRELMPNTSAMKPPGMLGKPITVATPLSHKKPPPMPSEVVKGPTIWPCGLIAALSALSARWEPGPHLRRGRHADTLTTNLGHGAQGVVVGPDGKLVVAGFTGPAFADFSGPAFALVRFLADGSLDATFTAGTVTTDFGGLAARAHALARQPDGKLVAAGASSSSTFTFTDFALAYYESGLVLGVGPPINKDECKHNGWRTFTIPRAFKNQGDCIQFVNPGR